jgi:hypothetical protein
VPGIMLDALLREISVLHSQGHATAVARYQLRETEVLPDEHSTFATEGEGRDASGVVHRRRYGPEEREEVVEEAPVSIARRRYWLSQVLFSHHPLLKSLEWVWIGGLPPQGRGDSERHIDDGRRSAGGSIRRRKPVIADKETYGARAATLSAVMSAADVDIMESLEEEAVIAANARAAADALEKRSAYM